MNPSRLFTDTTDFMAIEYGDQILVDGKRYTVTGVERERRFGIEDPKHWVKRVVDARSGERKIIKLSYFETFEAALGEVKIRCFRDPEKEAAILDLVKNHPSFMQGYSHTDPKGNNIRVLDIVRGSNFLLYLNSLRMPHELYFHKALPGILSKLVTAFEAIRFLHNAGFRHGDIRNDHLVVDQQSGEYVWIDFDYDYESGENPFGLDIFGLGNILLYAIGKGFHNLYMIQNDSYTYGDLIERITPEDMSILHKARFMNLRKIYPYIPGMLNNILMYFSMSTTIYYEIVDEMLDDLRGYLRSL
ncbi:MAG: protein kinase [Pseudomonadota bacterium]